MKRENGFTLIELLAVIVILAIVLVIAVLSVSKQIRKARRDAFEQTAVSVSKAAEKLYITNQGSSLIDFDDYDNELELDGEVPKHGKVQIHEDGDVSFAITNGEYCAIKTRGDKAIMIEQNVKGCNIETATNLVKNGYGEYGDNTNFSQLKYINDKQPFFSRVSSKYETLLNNEFIRVDANNNYYQSIEMKNNNTSTNYYVGIVQYDIDKKQINEVNVGYLNEKSRATLTTLAKDLNPGDTVVYLSDVSKFENLSTTVTSRLGLIFWNYKDSTGYEYPELTYSGYSWYGIYEYTGVDKSNNTITLKKPWGYRAFKAGTKLSQTQPYKGATYQYSVINGGRLTNDWKEYKNESFKLQYNEAKYIKYLILNNYNSAPDVTTDFRNFVFRKAD